MLSLAVLSGASAFHARPLAFMPFLRTAPASMVDSWYDSGTRLEADDDSVNAAFASVIKTREKEELIASELSRLSLPDVPLWLVFEDVAQPIVLPGSATTSALHAAASAAHNLDPNQRIHFRLKGKPLPLGVALAESPLAQTRNLHVHVVVPDWPVKRGGAFPSSSAAVSATAATAVAAHKARRDVVPRAKHVVRCDSGSDGSVAQAEHKRLLPPTPFAVQCPECGGIWQQKLCDVLTEVACKDCGHTFYAQHPDTVPPPEPTKRRKKPMPAWMESPPLSAGSGSSGSASGSTFGGSSVAPW